MNIRRNNVEYYIGKDLVYRVKFNISNAAAQEKSIAIFNVHRNAGRTEVSFVCFFQAAQCGILIFIMVR